MALEGSRWDLVNIDSKFGDTKKVLVFHDHGKLEILDPDLHVVVTAGNDHWELRGEKVILRVNDGYAKYEGEILAKQMMIGVASNTAGFKWEWRAFRKTGDAIPDIGPREAAEAQDHAVTLSEPTPYSPKDPPSDSTTPPVKIRRIAPADVGLVSGSAQSPATAQEIPLQKAVEAGDKELVARLLAEGAEVNAKDKDGVTPLHVTTIRGDKEVVVLLLAKGADVNMKDSKGGTPLRIAAAIRGLKEIAELLLANGADVNAQDSNGATPLHWAAIESNKEGAVLLLASGAKVNASDAECVPLRVGRGQFIIAPIGKGHTPLHWVGAGGNKEMAELLLARGAEVNARSSGQKRAPLHFAAIMGNNPVATILLFKGAEVNTPDGNGKTPLHLAASSRKHGQYVVAKSLLAGGAEVNAVDNNGKTPMNLAQTDKMKALLRKYGGK